MRRGDLQSARNTCNSHLDEPDCWTSTRVLLGIARAQAGRGDNAGARQTCDDALRDADKEPWLLIDVARTQVRIGDDRAGHTLETAEALINALPAKSQDRAYLTARLAVPLALPVMKRTTQFLNQARAVLDLTAKDPVQKQNNDNDRRWIAYAYARLGDFANATRVAASIEDTWRDWTYAGIAIAQWSKCDLNAAQRTLQAGPEGDLRDEILVELARARSLRADVETALTTTRLIKDDWRRAQATLEIAASMAKQGKKQEAQRLVASINYLRIRGIDADQQHAGEQLKFDLLAKWGTSTARYSAHCHSQWEAGNRVGGRAAICWLPPCAAGRRSTAAAPSSRWRNQITGTSARPRMPKPAKAMPPGRSAGRIACRTRAASSLWSARRKGMPSI